MRVSALIEKLKSMPQQADIQLIKESKKRKIKSYDFVSIDKHSPEIIFFEIERKE